MKFKITTDDMNDPGLYEILNHTDENHIIDMPDNTYMFFETLNQYSDTIKRHGRFRVNMYPNPPEIYFMNSYD